MSSSAPFPNCQLYIGHRPNGVLLIAKSNRNKALIRADFEDRIIVIEVNGNPSTRRDFLMALRSEFDNIHATIPRLEVTSMIAIPQNPSILVDYDYLIQLEEMGEQVFVPPGLRERISVKRLLNGVRVIPSLDREELYDKLVHHFNEEELKTLCFKAKIDYENLSGAALGGKVRELISLCERHNMLEEFIDLSYRERPEIFDGR